MFGEMKLALLGNSTQRSLEWGRQVLEPVAYILRQSEDKGPLLQSRIAWKQWQVLGILYLLQKVCKFMVEYLRTEETPIRR